jgi:hypothetical protein
LIASRKTVVMDSTDAVDPGFARLVEEQAALRRIARRSGAYRPRGPLV